MASDPLRGKRYVNLLRVSTKLNDTSIADQKKIKDSFAKLHGMAHIKDIRLFGVSGAKTFNRRDIIELLKERRDKNSYDVILVYDSSRLTRGGPAHGIDIRLKFAKAGVLVQSVMDPVPAGDFQTAIQAFIDTNNHLYAKKNSGYVTRGIVEAIIRGDYEHHGGLPLGIDRLYIRADGVPHIRLRYTGGRCRELIDESSQKVIRSLRPGVDEGTAYKKQNGERVVLTPGDPKVVAAIREAFHLRYKHGWGYGRIVLFFANSGIRPLRSLFWQSCTVRSMLQNPIYLGHDYFLKYACGLFHMGSPQGPVERVVDQGDLEERGIESVPHVKRPRAEMVRTDLSRMDEFLKDADAVVRERAEAAINRVLDKHNETPPKRNVMNNNPHPTSTFILRSVLKEVKTGSGFKGLPQNGYRHYRLSAWDNFERGSFARRGVPADQLESKVLEVVRRLLRHNSKVRPKIEAYVERMLAAERQGGEQAHLRGELQQIKNTIDLIYATATKERRAEQMAKIEQLNMRREEIERALSAFVLSSIGDSTETITERVWASIASLENNLDGAPTERLRLLVESLCDDFKIDLKTMEARFVLRVPEPFLHGGFHGIDDFCLSNSGVHSAMRQTEIKSLADFGFCYLRCEYPARERGWKRPRTPRWVEVQAHECESRWGEYRTPDSA